MLYDYVTILLYITILLYHHIIILLSNYITIITALPYYFITLLLNFEFEEFRALVI